MDDFTSAPAIVAVAGAAIGVVALLLAVALAIRLRRLRAAQTVVLGDGSRDLVAHSARLERGFGELREWVEETLGRLDQRLAVADERLDRCIAYRALIRYDAYGEMSGRQSSSLALLDARRSGVVVSSILHRDQARVYVKHVHEGHSDIELSPEEREAIDTALAGGPAPAAAAYEQRLRA
jgi:hypothetical protein